MNELGQFLQAIVDRAPNALSTVLIAHGVDTDKPTPQLVLQTYQRVGQPFVDDLVIMTPEEMKDLLHAEGGSFLNKVTALFQKAAPVIAVAKDVLGKSSTSATQSTDPLPPSPAGINTKKIIIIGGIVVVILIVALVVIKKFKK